MEGGKERLGYCVSVTYDVSPTGMRTPYVRCIICMKISSAVAYSRMPTVITQNLSNAGREGGIDYICM